MQLLPLHTPSEIKSQYEYSAMLFDHYRQKRDQKDVQPGFYAFPGDLQLLSAYKVTPEDILKTVINVINEAKIPEIIFQCKLAGCHEAKLELSIDKHIITVILLNSANRSKSTCPYCKIDLMSELFITIYNINNKTQLAFPYAILHLLEHGDLGDKFNLHIDPTITCKALGIGNLKLNGNSPLYKIALEGKRSYIRFHEIANRV